jgi:hypothetical protein
MLVLPFESERLEIWGSLEQAVKALVVKLGVNADIRQRFELTPVES